MRMSDIEPLLKSCWRPDPIHPDVSLMIGVSHKGEAVVMGKCNESFTSAELARRFEHDLECVFNPQRFSLGERQQAASNIDDVVSAFSPQLDGIELESAPAEVRRLVEEIVTYDYLVEESETWFEEEYDHNPECNYSCNHDCNKSIDAEAIKEGLLDCLISESSTLDIGDDRWFSQ